MNKKTDSKIRLMNSNPEKSPQLSNKNRKPTMRLTNSSRVSSKSIKSKTSIMTMKIVLHFWQDSLNEPLPKYSRNKEKAPNY